MTEPEDVADSEDPNEEVGQGVLAAVALASLGAASFACKTTNTTIELIPASYAADVIWAASIGTAASPGELRTLSAAAGTVVVAAGFWSAVDGGGGIFYADDDSSAVDDGGTVIPGAGGAVWKRVFSGALNVRWFGAKGDGATNDTAAFTAANAAGTDLLAPSTATFCLQNWVPSANTTLVARGATIQRHNSADFYSTTAAMASIVITNSNIRILGGTHNGKSALPSWSGSILIEGGTNITIRDAAFFPPHWSGIFGHEFQNGTKEAQNVLIDGCTFNGCGHNTYIADIDGLTITNCRSYDSVRDGIRVFRNSRNITITKNHIYNNGNNDAGQSRDGIDLYTAGFRCVISGNHIHDCKVQGIDLKLASTTAGETYQDHEYIITENTLYNNGASGIHFVGDADAVAPAANMRNFTISGNHIFGNTEWGIRMKYADHVKIHGNQIYSNGHNGIRAELSNDGLSIRNNLVYDNGTVLDPAYRAGINILPTVANCIVTRNSVYSTAASVSQSTGIGISGTRGRLFDNLAYGHSGLEVTTPNVNGDTGGKSIVHSIDAAHQPTPAIAFALDRACQLASMILTLNGTGDVNVAITKRNAAGAWEATLVSQNGLTLTGYVPLYLGLTADTAARTVLAGRALYVMITNVSNVYTVGSLVVNYID